MENAVFIAGNVLPVFLLIVAGWIAGRARLLNAPWSEVSSRLVFRLCLPALVFTSIYASDFRSAFSPGLLIFAAVATLLSLPLLYLGARLLLSEPPARGAFIQGGFRGNFVLLAFPVIGNVFGEMGKARAAILIAAVMPLYNALSVFILASHSREAKSAGPGQIIRGIATNPLILAALAAIPFAALGWRLPVALEKFLSYLASVAVPLSLLELGANMSRRRIGERPLAVMLATLYKVAVLPACFVGTAFALGFKGVDIGIIFMLGATPTAVASYVMAKSMGNDENLAGEIVLATTVVSMVTIFAGLWGLRTLGLA
jgi:predicted permease